MIQFERSRSIKYASSMMSAASPESAQKVSRILCGFIYPEEAYDEADYVRKAEDTFKKLRGVDLFVQPTV